MDKPKMIENLYSRIVGDGIEKIDPDIDWDDNSIDNNLNIGYNKAIEKREEWLKDKCSVEKLEGIIDVNTFKGGISMVQDYILVPKKDLATALNRYIIEDKQ